MEVRKLDIPGVVVLIPERFEDERGFFSETLSYRRLSAAGLDRDFVQENHSYSVQAGVLRGLHYQKPPYAQAKLVRCTRGAILDIAVDLRSGSATFGQYVSAELSAENWAQIYVPEGFAHGFLTLQPHTEVQYSVTAYYEPSSEVTIGWNDSELNIQWGIAEDDVLLSKKDRNGKVLNDVERVF